MTPKKKSIGKKFCNYKRTLDKKKESQNFYRGGVKISVECEEEGENKF